MQLSGWVFFDRGLIDAAAAFEDMTGEPQVNELARVHRYNSHVFLTPPWPEIYEQDQERRHTFAETVAEYERLLDVCPRAGYRIHILPKTGVEARADFILATLDATAG